MKLNIGQRFLNVTQVSKRVVIPSKMTSVQGDQVPAKQVKMWNKLKDRRVTVRELAVKIDIGYGVYQEILTENLKLRCIAANFLPRRLTNDP